MTPPSAGSAPLTVWRVIHGLGAYWTLVAAVELGIFARLAEAPAGDRDLAGRCGAPVERMEALMGGLVATGLVQRAGDIYRLTDEAEAFLVPGRTGYMGPLILQSPGPHPNWPALSRTVSGEDPPHPAEDDAGGFYRDLVAATFATQHRTAAAVAADLEVADDPTLLRLLDLGAGAAPWSIALLQALPAARAVVNDLPEVIDVAGEHLARFGLADRAAMRPGDYLEVALEAASFDVVVLGHVCRAAGAAGAARLVARAAEALRPGGLLLLADYFLDDDKQGPAHAQMLGVTMMASTRQGMVRTLAEARAWLAAAGMGPPRQLMPIPPTTVLASRKEEPR